MAYSLYMLRAETYRIMAVTKHHSMSQILPIISQKNITLIGESRWQEAKEKLPLFPAGIEKHFIGHLQSNKAKEVVAAFDAVESVDSLKLAEALNQTAQLYGKVLPIFLQVNISNDPAKYGFIPEALPDAVAAIQRMLSLRLVGLMTITAKQSDEDTRQDFKRMKQLQLQFSLPELSMGMSSDWQIAIEEGATIVRLGTALFGERLS